MRKKEQQQQCEWWISLGCSVLKCSVSIGMYKCSITATVKAYMEYILCHEDVYRRLDLTKQAGLREKCFGVPWLMAPAQNVQ